MQRDVKVKREMSVSKARGSLERADHVFHHHHCHFTYVIKLMAQRTEQGLTIIGRTFITFLFHVHLPKHRLVTDRGMQLLWR